MDRKQLFMFRIVYFKPNGKFHTETTVGWEMRDTAGEECPFPLPDMNDAIAKLRGLRDSGGPGAMPGLSATLSDGWNGPILIDCPDGYPCLILPDDK